MSDLVLTAEQAAAVTVDGSAVVRAGAGSGKTTVLASRVLHLIGPDESGGPPVRSVDSVLAITFTDRAASETRRRIHELVAARIATSTGVGRRHWERLRGELVGARISTIHAFCARLLREHPLEAGIDPRATILDEQAARAWNERAIEHELTARVRQGDPAATALLQHRRGLAGGRGADGAVATVARLLGRLLVSGRDGAWLEEALRRQQAMAPAARSALVAAVEHLRGVMREALATEGKGKVRDRVAGLWPRCDALFDRMQRLEADLELGPLRSLRADMGRLKVPLAPALEFESGALRGTIVEEYHFLTALPLTAGVSALLGTLAQVLRQRKQQEGVLTFDDLVFEADRLLADHPAVAAACARGLDAILVDEFQDTDAVQASVVSRLAGANSGCRVFVVGDEKQSIYRFRGADVRVFNTMRTRLGTELNLGTNFRSRPGILAVVNAIAAHTMRVPSDGDAERWTVFDPSHRLVPARPADGAGPAVRFVSLLPARAGRQLNAAAVRELEARVLAGVLRDMHGRAERRMRWGEIAVLFRSLVPVKAYEHALRKHDIPYYVVKGRGFFQCQEVRDIASFLALVADGDDELALAAVLRSPLLGIPDDVLERLAWPPGAERPQMRRGFSSADFGNVPEVGAELERLRELVGHLRRVASRATVAEVIERILASTDFEAVLLTQFQGGQRVANVRKLIELARRLETRRPIGLTAFVRTVEELMQREPREAEAALANEQDDVVRLMTIHQAKGLEFRGVILADLGRDPEADRQQLVLDDELGLIVGPVGGAGGQPLGQARLSEYRARERDRDRAERARLLYVGATRARDELVLLEGRGDEAYLRDQRGSADRWCHQLWDVFGREAILQVAAGATEVVVDIDGHPVAIEGAAHHLVAAAPLAASEPREVDASSEARRAVARVVGFTAPAAEEIVVSPTALATFRRCPRQYWYAHVLGLSAMGEGGARARLAGTVVHGVLEVLDPAVATPADVEAALGRRAELWSFGTATRARLRADLLAAVKALGDEARAGLQVIGREVPFVLGLPAERPRVLLEGRIDVVAQRGGTVVVRDYKYTRAADANMATYAPQLACYALALPTSAPVVTEVVFLRDGTVVKALPPVDRMAEATAIVAAADGLATARRTGTLAAHPRGPVDPAACRALGCGYVRACWDRRLTDTALRPATRTAGA